VESLLSFHEEGVSTGPPIGTDTNPPRFAAGQVFAGRYRMIARLGRGGMGEVWRADDLTLGTPVALKFIRSATAGTRGGILNEVRLARKITHPAVCRVFDVGEDHGEVFLSMELVRGEDLASLIRRVGRLPSEKVIDIARQLCGGLAAAHAGGVLHRDLKPANVLIDEQGQVRITDFGIAVAGLDRVPRRWSGRRLMAPEQLLPGAPLTERTDIYALGCSYELVVGQHAFTRSGTRVNPNGPDVPAIRESRARARHTPGALPGSAGPTGIGGGGRQRPADDGRAKQEGHAQDAMVAAGSCRCHRRGARRHRHSVRAAAQRQSGADGARHHRAGRLREHDRRSGVRRRPQVALAVAVNRRS
jgi:hypothetical protein